MLDDYLWIVVVGGIICFFFACAMGANDVANSFGTVVGTKTLNLFWAVVIASIFEFLGSMVMGDAVSGTLRTGLVKEGVFRPGEEHLYMIGMFAVILGPAICIVFATYLSLPISTTHAVVGGIVGFVISLKGYNSIQWVTVGKIALSWVLSPVVGAITAAPLYFFIKRFILSKNPGNRSIVFFPIISGITVGLVFGSIFIKGSPSLKLDKIPLYISIPTTFGVGLLVTVVIALLSPFIKKRMTKWVVNKIQKKKEEKEKEMQIVASSNELADIQDSPFKLEDEEENIAKEEAEELLEDGKSQEEIDRASLEKQAEYFDAGNDLEVQQEIADSLYRGLMVFCAALTSFSHGANDVSNAIGPYSAIYSVYSAAHLQIDEFVPIWILFLGAVGIVVGLATFGHRVIKTVGSSLTKKQLIPSQGFTSQLCGATFVMVASKFGMPVSTTNALVGAVIGVGMVEDIKGVKWKLLLEVFVGWITTLPISAMLSSALFSFLKWTVI
ncbi:hypothetical protein ABK040_002963 [Willaertia magna]